MDQNLKINEIFYSIQGESTWAGVPTVFVRTTGCNLRCTYCDTKYSYFEGQNQSFQQIFETIQSYNTKFVCVTGGEPLIQPQIFSFMKQLADMQYNISLETSGSKSIRNVDPRVKTILDVKTPESGAKDSFAIENLSLCTPSTEFKFVIGSEADFDWSENFCRQHEIFEKYVVLYSPSYEEISPKWLAQKILLKKSSARLQLQQHKYIWSAGTRGV